MDGERLNGGAGQDRGNGYACMNCGSGTSIHYGEVSLVQGI